jgi:predicted metal-dependent hydrolase
MKALPLYDEEALNDALKRQKRLAWNLNTSIRWRRGIDFAKPLVPLDDYHIIFPGKLTFNQKLAVSQFMGLLIASTFSETEKALGRLRVEAWEDMMRKRALNPEIIAMGKQFFTEEDKHSLAFDRYIEIFAKGVNVDAATLKGILPSVDAGWVESSLRRNAKQGGLVLWWIVATVEEESTQIFRQMVPFRQVLDPLYYELHKRHFEEEARHAPYAFMILDLCLGGKMNWRRFSLDFVRSEIMKMMWMMMELTKSLKVRELRDRHSFFAELDGLLASFKWWHLPTLLLRFVRETPYISPFVNAQYHGELTKTLKRYGCPRLPLPRPTPARISWQE